MNHTTHGNKETETFICQHSDQLHVTNPSPHSTPLSFLPQAHFAH